MAGQGTRSRVCGFLFVIDFDGTVAPTDTVDALLERFADPEWRRIEQEWVAGNITSRECMAQQIALVRGRRAVLEEFLHSVVIDPSFEKFVEYIRPFAEIAVISDGLDEPIRHALRNIDIPIFANRLEYGRKGLALHFPYGDVACEVGSGVCKCAVARSIAAGRAMKIVLVGDGRSDLCIARHADVVFAKGSLLRFCESEGIRYTPFETFEDVLNAVQRFQQSESNSILAENACIQQT